MKARESRLAVVLWVYPKSYREKRSDEIFGTLLDSAPPSNRLEMVRVVFDVLAYGVRRRSASPRITEQSAPLSPNRRFV